MRPRLQRILPPNRRGKTAGPAFARIMLDDILDGVFVDEFRVEAHVICETLPSVFFPTEKCPTLISPLTRF